MSETRYTVEQVLRGIEAYFRVCGDKKTVIDADASVYEYLEAATKADGECPLYFLVGLGEYFNLDWPEERWLAWLRVPKRVREAWCSLGPKRNTILWKRWEREVAPELTVRRLAEYIARKAPGVSMAPKTIFGQSCAPAGVFLGLASLADTGGGRIAPSTSLVEKLGPFGLSAFWRRAEWVSGKKLPSLNSCEGLLRFEDRAIGLANSAFWGAMLPAIAVAAVFVCSAANAGSGYGWLAGLLALGFLGVVGILASWAKGAAFQRLATITPPGITTFGELARYIAAPLALLCCSPAFAQFHYTEKPVEYGKAPFNDQVAQLKQAIDEGLIELEWDKQHGWLPSLMEYLSVRSSSQTLVFSKTSLQRKKISTKRPRALYYNDDVYVGWIQHAPLIELSAVDPKQGAVFYTVRQQQTKKPVISPDNGQCLSCHATRQTSDVPGYLIRSVFTDSAGEPQFNLGSDITSPATPFKKRYGGWYVTCKSGEMSHRGNLVFKDGELSPLDKRSPETLDGLVDTEPYLEPGSDIVALMVLEHQAEVHNLITSASFDTRNALYYDGVLNRALDRPDEQQSNSTQRRIQSSARKLVRALLFCDEAPLTSPVVGSSRFAEEFASRGPFDKQRRSFRQFDLKTRLFRYRCSYLIYSESLDALPKPVLDEVRRQLSAALSDAAPADYEHLTAAERRGIREILDATKSGFLVQAEL